VGSLRDNRLELTCRSSVAHESCRIELALEVGVERSLHVMNGSANWRVVRAVGSCGPVLDLTGLGERVEIWGTRIGSDPGSCSAPPASLVEKLLGHPELIRLMPPPIEDLSARADGRTAGLRWTPPRLAVAYDVYRARVNAPFEHIARTRARAGQQEARFHDGRLPPGRTYRYVVRWIGADGRESPVSNEVHVTADKAWPHHGDWGKR
jgi:hypothetical protein